jgi:hypothetical protein
MQCGTPHLTEDHRLRLTNICVDTVGRRHHMPVKSYTSQLGAAPHLLETRAPPQLCDILLPSLLGPTPRPLGPLPRSLYCSEATKGNIPLLTLLPPNTNRLITLAAFSFVVPHSGEFSREGPALTADVTYSCNPSAVTCAQCAAHQSCGRQKKKSPHSRSSEVEWTSAALLLLEAPVPLMGRWGDRLGEQ